jgi:hypothetical protein
MGDFTLATSRHQRTGGSVELDDSVSLPDWGLNNRSKFASKQPAIMSSRSFLLPTRSRKCSSRLEEDDRQHCLHSRSALEVTVWLRVLSDWRTAAT